MKSSTTLTTALTSFALAITASMLLPPTNTPTPTPPHIHSLFKQFITDYKKSYSTPEEYNHRLKIFTENYFKTQTLASRNDITHQVGITKFFDLTLTEFFKKYTGLKFTKSPRTQTKKYFDFIKKNTLKKNPSWVDWRKADCVTKIKDQKKCGSCWAFSTTASIETAYAQTGNALTSLSEQQLVDCSSTYGNDGCNGGWMDDAFRYVVDHGIQKEDDYPYVARDQTCKAQTEKFVTSMEDWVDVPASNGQYLEDCVARATVSVAVDATFFWSYTGGIVAEGTCGKGNNHGVAIVGYGTDTEGTGKDYWIVRNCWGTSWGMEGYMWIEKNVQREGKGTCAIREKASFAVV